MFNIKISCSLHSETALFYVDRLGKYGSMTYEYDILEKAFDKAEQIASKDSVLFVRIWN